MTKHRCEKIITNPPHSDRQCERNATVCIDANPLTGLYGYEQWYCKQHDPEEIYERELTKNH